MFAVGHLALGYLLGRGTSRLADVKVNLPLLFSASIIPDVDLLFPITHRGVTHSVIVQTLLMLPFLVYYRKKALPYYIALLSHGLVGDILSESSSLLWPIFKNAVGGSLFALSGPEITLLELLAFASSLIVMFQLHDFRRLLTSGISSIILTVPTVALIIPVIVRDNYLAIPTPRILIIPSLIDIALFASAIAAAFYFFTKKHARTSIQNPNKL